MENLKEKILKEYEKGNIVVNTCEGIEVMNLKTFLEQPVEGILYDLNRDEITILTLMDDPKWINDFAACKVIQELKRQIDEQKHKLKI
jgi:hypothetical protein